MLCSADVGCSGLEDRRGVKLIDDVLWCGGVTWVVM